MPKRTYTISVGESKIIDDVLIYMKRFYSEKNIHTLKTWLKFVVEQIGISRIKRWKTTDIYRKLIDDGLIRDTTSNKSHVTAAADTLRKFMGTAEFTDYRTYEEKFFEDV